MIKEKIVINDHVQGDPLSEENLDKTLNSLHKFRLLLPEKTIWLYTGYNFQKIIRQLPNIATKENHNMWLRQKIVEQCDVIVDGRYIDSKRDITLKWRGSSNQRVIDVQKTLEQNEVILYCE